MVVEESITEDDYLKQCGTDSDKDMSCIGNLVKEIQDTSEALGEGRRIGSINSFIKKWKIAITSRCVRKVRGRYNLLGNT